MKIHRDPSEVPYQRVVATIGNFDGVHCGHQWVMAQVIQRARDLGAISLAITFDPHPARVLRPDLTQRLITPLNAKLDLLAATGLDATLVLPFDSDLARMSARNFAKDVLYRSLHVIELHEGENFRFGYRAEAGVDALSSLGEELGFAVVRYLPRLVHGSLISSSRIREMIAEGDINSARKLLGRPFSVESTPASGRGYGTRYAVPTINLAPYEELLPAHGVYATTLEIGKPAARSAFEGVTNVGNRPTFGVDSFAVESHLLDFHPVELQPDTPLRMTFHHRLRPEIRWNSPDALRAQIGRDIVKTRRYFDLKHLVATRRTAAHVPA